MAAPMSQGSQPAMNPAIPAEAHPQPSQSQAQTDIDPVAKVKILLLPRLKDSLVVSLCFIYHWYSRPSASKHNAQGESLVALAKEGF